MDGGVLGLPAHSDTEAFSNLIDALRVAESAAKQLAFYRSQPAWLKVQLSLENVRLGVTALATSRTH